MKIEKKTIMHYLVIVFTSLAEALAVMFVNWLLEFSSMVSRWLCGDCPIYIEYLGRTGFCWLSCDVLAVSCFVMACKRKFKSYRQSRIPFISFPLILGIIGVLASLVVIDVIRETQIPLVGGYYDYWPESLWDWLVICLSCFALASSFFAHHIRGKFWPLHGGPI